MPRKALPFAFVLALIAAACASPQHAEVEFGSGARFVPLVADSLNDAGRHVQVAIDQEGRPLVAYFAFAEETAEGVLPQTRPVGAPSIPGVLMATLNEDGIWTRGAIALQGQITGVDVPFNPAFDPAIADLTAENVTGLDMVVDGDRFHAVWGSNAGAFYATGAMPSVAVTPDGEAVYLAWYDTQHEDVLLGSYGEIEGLALAEPSPEPTPEPAAPAPQPEGDCTPVSDGVLEITAQGLEFDTGCVDVAAGEPFTIAFTNEDPDQHNVAIYPSPEELTDPLFRGDIIAGPDTVEYPPVDPLDPGEYYFQCDVHPTTMNGTVVADEGGGDGGGGGGGAGGGESGGGAGGGQGAALTGPAQNISFGTRTHQPPPQTANT